MNRIDLHIHSIHSDDGELEVREILHASEKLGMRVISITDHNTVEGVAKVEQYKKEYDIEVIPGIEIDCTFESVNLHLLGYYINHEMKEFYELQKDMRKQEMNALPEKIEKLRQIGIEADIEEILYKAKGKIICGEFIGEVILNKKGSKDNRLLWPYLQGGNRSDMPYLNFYRDFFTKGKAAYVPLKYLSLNDAVDLIKKSNGLPVIAHPADNLRNQLHLIDDIIRQGVVGIEVFSNYHTPEEIHFLQKKAEEHNILITCGSDFHGKNKPGISIGHCKYTLCEEDVIRALEKARDCK